MPTIDINGIELWYERTGIGRACVVVHGGLGIDHRFYLASLARLLDACDVVFYDQRGNGRSGRPPPSTITIEQLADDAATIIDRIGLDAPVVFGHSFGGFVAQELALRHRHLVGALLLVGTGPGQLGADEDPDAAPMMDGTAYSRDAMVRGFEVLASWSSVDRLHMIAAPTLLIVGAHDVFISPPQSRRIASRIPGSTLVEFDASGLLPDRR